MTLDLGAAKDWILAIAVPVLAWILYKIIDHGERLIRQETLMTGLVTDVKEMKEETKAQTPLLTSLVTSLISTKQEKKDA